MLLTKILEKYATIAAKTLETYITIVIGSLKSSLKSEYVK